MPSAILVSDTNVWIDLYHGELLDVVFDLPYRFVTSDFAYKELRRPPGRTLTERGLEIEVFSIEQHGALFELQQEHSNPSLADVSCFLLARENGWPLVTGDKKLRTAGEKEKVQIRGVLWILDELARLELVSAPDLARALQEMLSSNARLPEQECRQRIKKWSPP